MEMHSRIVDLSPLDALTTTEPYTSTAEKILPKTELSPAKATTTVNFTIKEDASTTTHTSVLHTAVQNTTYAPGKQLFSIPFQFKKFKQSFCPIKPIKVLVIYFIRYMITVKTVRIGP